MGSYVSRAGMGDIDWDGRPDLSQLAGRVQTVILIVENKKSGRSGFLLN